MALDGGEGREGKDDREKLHDFGSLCGEQQVGSLVTRSACDCGEKEKKVPYCRSILEKGKLNTLTHVKTRSSKRKQKRSDRMLET